MDKYIVSDLHGNGHVNEEVYLASEVDARIAELESILREAHYFASEDFQFSDHYNSLTIDDVCATQRYIDYWKALNNALGL